MHINSNRILAFLLLTLPLFSCKKETDDLGPTVTIISPSENQSFHVNDVVRIKALVSDQVKITSVTIRLVDDRQNPMHVAISAPVTSPSMTVNIDYPLDNIHLESGIYALLITASDGKNDSRYSRKIYITAIPKVVKNIIVISCPNTSQTNLSIIDSSFNTISLYHSFPGNYMGSSVSSYFQQAYMCDNSIRNFTGIKLIDNSIRFNISPKVSTSPYYTGFYSTEKNNYMARYDGYIIGYGYAGQIIYNALAENGSVAQHFCFNDSYLIAEEKNSITSAKKLITYYPSGGAQQSTSLSQDVVTFCEKDDDEVFLFGNVSGQGVIQLFNRGYNNIGNPYPYPLNTGTILSAVKIDANTYLIGHSNGTIYKYEYSNFSMTTYLSGYAAVQLKYDFEANRLYVAEANRISSFDYPTSSFLGSVNSPEAVLDIHLLYNR